MHQLLFSLSIFSCVAGMVTSYAPPTAAGGASVCQPVIANDVAPRGRVENHHGINMYITKPTSPNSRTSTYAILYLSDVLGIQLLENRLLADSFANAGYLVVAPDLFNGKPAPDDHDRPDLGFVIADYLNAHPPNITDPIVETAIRYIRSELGVKRLGVTGYCFGGRYGFRFASQEKRDAGLGTDVVAAAHPTFLMDDEITARLGPATIAAAEFDVLMQPGRRFQIETALFDTEVPASLAAYSGVQHGFGVRGNISDPQGKFAKESAYCQAVRWFDYWL